MLRHLESDVLIVGAGPVGMTAALLLARAGVESILIEERNRTATRSYACGLHPHSLAIFSQLGLLPEILERGQRIETMAFYDGPERCTEINLADVSPEHPFGVVLPQNTLEEILEAAIAREPRVTLQWHHRLAQLVSRVDSAVATVEKLAGTSLGYIVPHWEMVVQDTRIVTARHVIGADGQNSMVRRCLGIDFETVGAAEIFEVFEFETLAPPSSEVRVVLDGTSTNVLWPLPNGRLRWGFALNGAEAAEEFRTKGQVRASFDDPHADVIIARRFARLTAARAPWFIAPVREFDWVSRVQFERRLARQFGDGRCWLIGDAAHQTGPVGMQSMNLGLREAGELAALLANLVQADSLVTAGNFNYYEGSRYNVAASHPATCGNFADWNRSCRERWHQLLGLQGRWLVAPAANPWVRSRGNRLPPCLPASGAELDACCRQLGLTWSADR